MEKKQPRFRSSRNFGISDTGLALNYTGPRSVRVIGVFEEGLDRNRARPTGLPHIRESEITDDDYEPGWNWPTFEARLRLD